MKDLSRNIALHCPVCGNTMFSVLDKELENTDLKNAPDSAQFKCSDCGKVITKGELLQMNQGVIAAKIEDIKNEATKELEKELKKMFKKLK